MKIYIKTKELSIEAELNDSPAAKEIAKHLPIQSVAGTWGDEIYFDTGIKAPTAGLTLRTNVGDLGYWPQGKSFCIFFGPTPASSGSQPVPASKVVIIGKTAAPPEKLRSVKDGDKITVEASR